MSWDVLLFPVPPRVTAVEELPEDLPPVGALADVLAALRGCPHEIDLTDPAWGLLTGDTWSIEVNIGAEDPVDSVMLHVRGGGDGVLPVMAGIASALGCAMLDGSSGEFLAPGEPGAWHDFQAYRDRVAGHVAPRRDS